MPQKKSELALLVGSLPEDEVRRILLEAAAAHSDVASKLQKTRGNKIKRPNWDDFNKFKRPMVTLHFTLYSSKINISLHMNYIIYFLTLYTLHFYTLRSLHCSTLRFALYTFTL